MNRPGRSSVPERNHFIELDELPPAKGGCQISPDHDELSRKRINLPRTPLSSSAVGNKRSRYSEEVWRILAADNHLSGRFIAQPPTRYFLEALCPGITSILPSRRALGERLLDDHARRCYKKGASALRELQTSGDRVNLLTDVW
eukprot:jgi/Phyca11/48077/gw1.53.246.1